MSRFIVVLAIVFVLDAIWWWGPERFISLGDVTYYLPYAAIAVGVASIGWARSGTWKYGIWIALGSVAGTAVAFYALWRLFLLDGS